LIECTSFFGTSATKLGGNYGETQLHNSKTSKQMTQNGTYTWFGRLLWNEVNMSDNSSA